MSNKKNSDEEITSLPEGTKDMSENAKLFDSVFFRQEVNKLQKIYNSKRMTSFDVAFCVWDSFQEWNNRQSKTTFKYFLEEYTKAGGLVDKASTLKVAYYVAEAFPDLRAMDNRKKPFECYRLIASSGLSVETKKSLRDVLEQDDLDCSKIKKRVKEAQKKEGQKIQDDFDKDEAEITYRNMSLFGRKFREVFNPSEGMRFHIKVLNKEKQGGGMK